MSCSQCYISSAFLTRAYQICSHIIGRAVKPAARPASLAQYGGDLTYLGKPATRLQRRHLDACIHRHMHGEVYDVLRGQELATTIRARLQCLYHHCATFGALGARPAEQDR